MSTNTSRQVMAVLALVALSAPAAAAEPAAEEVRWFAVPRGAGPHDVAPARDGTVWYTAQQQGALGRLDPASGRAEQIPPKRRNANLNTPTFDRRGRLWFTGQSGVYGRLDPATGAIDVWDAPRGSGPYGIATTSGGDVYYASLAGSHIARIDTETGAATVIEPPTPRQGARRVWPDSKGRVWVSEWNSGQVSVFDPSSRRWQSWRLPGERPRAYSVYVDERDRVWLSDFGANAIVRFDPDSERFTAFPSDRPAASVRQLLGRRGEVWGAESATDRLVVIRSGVPRG